MKYFMTNFYWLVAESTSTHAHNLSQTFPRNGPRTFERQFVDLAPRQFTSTYRYAYSTFLGETHQRCNATITTFPIRGPMWLFSYFRISKGRPNINLFHHKDSQTEFKNSTKNAFHQCFSNWKEIGWTLKAKWINNSLESSHYFFIKPPM